MTQPDVQTESTETTSKSGNATALILGFVIGVVLAVAVFAALLL